MNLQTLKTIGRWLAVIPAAIVGLFTGWIVSTIFFTLQTWFLGGSQDSFWSDINFYILSSGISGAAAVYFGCRTAPSHRKIVALVLGALIVVTATGNEIVGFINDGGELVWGIISAIASVTGAGWIVYLFFEEGEDFTISD